ncbi:MAG: PPC domain-containing protein [Gemmatimonadaceae bacterium]|nr:PPC domain-containing protein [Gemmatimonadaceae bacterium]
MTRFLATLFAMAMLANATTASAQTRITAGETSSGALTAGDSRMQNGAHFDLWTYSGMRGEKIVVTLRSIQFDAFMIVQRYPGGSSPLLARDDDGGSGSDARIELTLPDNDDYLITVTTTERGETGAYRLSVQSNRPVAQIGLAVTSVAARVEKPQSEGKSVAPTARMLVPGRTVTGSLGSSARGPLGSADGDWRYAGKAGETVTIDMRSSEFDPYLTLYSMGPSVTRVAQNDDGGGGLNSRIVYRLPADGEYVARAERRHPGRSGSYTLSFRSSAHSSLLGIRAAGDMYLAANSAVLGDLDSADPKMRDGTPYDLWKYVGRAGETIRVTLRSDDFDAFVSIGTVTNGVFTAIASADDGAGGTHSRLDLTLPFAGEFVIRANSLSPRTPFGDYVLRVESFR